MAKAKALTEGMQGAYRAGRMLARNFSSSSPHFPIEGYLQSLISEMKEHRALHHPFFNYLEEKSQKGFTPQQFDIYRTNFFHRTWQTIPCVARIVIAAAENQDAATLASVGKNIFEETGEGNPEHAHSLLLERSHNIHAFVVFGLPEQRLKNAVKSPLIVPSLHTFVEKQRELYTSPSYPTVLGTGFAHEFAADPMLTRFHKSLFIPYKGCHSPDQFSNKVSKYFDVHINGTEERHADDAKEAVKRTCQTAADIDAMRKAVFAFLDIQANLWDGMHHSIKEAESIGKIVEIRPEHVALTRPSLIRNSWELSTIRSVGPTPSR